MGSCPIVLPKAVVRESDARSPSETDERLRCSAAVRDDASDEMLLAAVKESNRNALAILFRRHAVVVRSVAVRILRDEGEADDLVQELFLFLFRKASIFDPSKSSGESWIIQMAYHRAIDRRRQLVSHRFYDSCDLNEQRVAQATTKDSEKHAVEHLSGKDLLNRYREVLSPEQRRILDLVFFEGYSLREVVEETGFTYASVRNHYYRAISKLRSALLPQER